MRYAKRFAAALVASALLAAGYAALFGAHAEAGQATGGKAPAPRVTSEASGPSEPAQSLSELLGLPGAKGVTYTTIKLTSNRLVYGSTFADKYEKFDLNGYTLTIYGDLTIYGSFNVNGGKLIIRRDPKLDASPSNPGAVNVTGNLIIKGGLLVMRNSADLVQTEKSVIAGGGNETGSLTAGTVKVGAHLLQLADYSPNSYNETGSHITAFSGANRLAVFETPLSSGITNFSQTTGTTFTAADTDIPVIEAANAGDGSANLQPTVYETTGGSFLCLRKLTVNTSISVPNLYFVGALGGCKLSVPGGNVIVPPGAPTDLGAGSVIAGSFTVSAGNIKADGGGTDVRIDKCTSTELSVGGASLSGDIGARSLTTVGSIAIPDGGTLAVGGSLTVQPGQTLAVGTGRLFVSGDMDVKGWLDMLGDDGVAVVRGNFTAEGGSSWGHLTGGLLVIQGNFTQMDIASNKSFSPGAGFKTILLGNSEQSVSFESPAGPGDTKDGDVTDASWFGALVNCNAAYPAGTLPAVSETVSSTKLTGFTAEAGGETLLPWCGQDDPLRYEIAVPVDAGAVSLTPLPVAADETITVSAGGSAAAGTDGSYSIPVNANETTTVTVEVRSKAVDDLYAGEGEPFRTTYTIVLQPQNPDLSSPGFSYATNFAFDAGRTDYQVTIPAKDESFTFSPALANPNASFRFSCDGVDSAGPTFTRAIAPGESTEVDVRVTSYSNANSPAVEKTYRFTFRRQTLLDDISLTFTGDPECASTLSPAFSRGAYEYSLDIPAAVYGVTVTPAKGDGCVSCAINGVEQDSVTLSPGVGGSATATIALTDGTGTYSKTYTLTVNRAPLLSGITVSYSSGDEIVSRQLPFSSSTSAYTVDVPIDSTLIDVTATKASVAFDTAVTGNNPDVAPGGTSDVTVSASAGADANQKADYTVTIRKHLLAGFSFPHAVTLSAPFNADPSVVTYVTIPYTWNSVTVVPVGNGGGEGAMGFSFFNGADDTGAPLPGGVVSLEQGETKTVCVKAEYGDVLEQYRLSVTREKSDDAALKSLGASAGWLSPAFNPGTTSYTLTIPETVSAIALRPAARDPHSTFRIDTLAPGVNKSVSVALNGSVKVKIAVTAFRGNVTTYTLTVRRVPMLSSFAAKPVYSGYPSLSPGGTNRMKIAYSLALPATVKLEVKKGTRWYTLIARTETSPGSKTWSWNGRVRSTTLAAGTYALRATPYYAGRAGTSRTLTVKILRKPYVSVVSLSSTTFKATGTSRLRAVVRWTRLTDAKVEVVNAAGRVVRTLYSATDRAPTTVTLYWDGKDARGILVPAGVYRIKVTCGGAAPVYRSVTVKR